MGIEVLSEGGEGVAARKGKRVAISLVGRFTGELERFGTFTSEDDELEGVKFRVGEKAIVRGLSEGVKGMRVGCQRRLLVSPRLGYGVNGHPPKIPPDAELNLVVKMLK